MTYLGCKAKPILLIGILILCAPDLAVRGYEHSHCLFWHQSWEEKEINWRASVNAFPAGTAWRTALNTANARWNEAPGNFSFGVRNWDEENVGRANGQNEIWASRNQRVLGGAPAKCSVRYTCGDFLEADIIFDADRNWSLTQTLSTKTPYGGTGRPWGTMMMHEMGHALGLEHVNNTYNVMGTDFTHIHANAAMVRYYVGEDTGNGAVHLYGRTTQIFLKTDLGVTHWKNGAPAGEYSNHIPCRIYNPDDSPVAREAEVPGGFKRYLVQAGQSYQVQFTFENNGYYDQDDVEVAHYISTNSWITTNDGVELAFGGARLRTGSMSLHRNTVYTAKHTITLPDDLVENGIYYIGVIVDYNNTIAEFNELNNATYLPIRIVP